MKSKLGLIAWTAPGEVVTLDNSANKDDRTSPVCGAVHLRDENESRGWRLNEINRSVRLPLADPDFLKSIENRQRAQNEQLSCDLSTRG